MNKSKENYIKPTIGVLNVEPMPICAGTNVNIGIGGLDDGKGGPAANRYNYFDDNSMWQMEDTEE